MTAATSEISEAQALELHARRNEAGVAGDAAALSELLSEDFLQVHGGGTLQNKAAYIESRLPRPTRIEFKSRQSFDQKIFLLGECFFVRENVDIVETFPEGSPYTKVGDHAVRVRVGTLWRREEDGQWRCLQTHVTNRTSVRALQD